MSGLGSLFSGFSANAENNDALKYSAPKEPKNRPPKPAATAPAAVSSERISPVPSTNSSTNPSTPVVKAPGPSKIMASAAVRLYKINPSTGSYDSVEGGSMLGCVLMGTGLTYQLLVYNAQKVPQATVAVTMGFDYSIKDLYMSFTDSSTQSQWSLLFDSVETMMNFTRTLVATIIHINSFTTTASTSSDAGTIRRSLPPTQPSDTTTAEETVLSVGMSVGVYLTVWELQEVTDYPGDVLTSSTALLKTVQPPDDVLKIKLSPGDELLGGLSNSLIGLAKGDHCLVGIPPAVFYSNTTTNATGNSLVDMTSRNYPGAWLLVEVEIMKVKSNEGKNNKKEKKKVEIVANGMSNTTNTSIPFATIDASSTSTALPSQQIDSPVQRIVKRMNGSGSFDEADRSSGREEVTARMARISSAGGGLPSAGMSLAGIVNPQHQQQQMASQEVPSAYAAASSHPPQQQQRHSDHYHAPQQQQHQYSRPQQGGAHQGGAAYTENRLAVVEGQGVRSYYTDTGDENPTYYQPSGYNKTGSGNFHPPPQPFTSAQDQQLTASGMGLLQQSVSTVQQSMLSLHTKLDQVGNNVNMSISMQQQQQQQAQFMHSPYMNTTAGASGVGIMGMSNYMNPQLAYQLQQQQLVHSGTGSNTAPTTSATPVRIKTNDIVHTLQALLSEYEQQQGLLANTASNSNGSAKEGELKDTVKALQSTVQRLEDKNESLQTRYDKLMTEKAELMQKYMDQFQTGATASQSVYRLQQEVDSLRAAQTAASDSSASSALIKEREQEYKNTIQTLEMQLLEQKHALDQYKQTTHSDNLQQRSEKDGVMQELKAMQEECTALREQKASLHSECKQAREENQALVHRLNTVTEEYEEKVRHLQEEANTLTTTSDNDNHEKERMRWEEEILSKKKEVSDLQCSMDSLASQHAEEKSNAAALIQELQQDLERVNTLLLQQQQNASTTSSSNNNELIKEIMQDIYVKACEVFTTEDDSTTTATGSSMYAAADVVKRIRAILKKVTTERTTA